VTKIAFASSAAMYGDATIIPTPESYSPIQTSFYGASKQACEGLIQAYCSAFGFQAWMFRFASIVGERYSHGFIYNFYRELKKTPTQLYVLGGKDQRKSYLYVQDCIDGILLAIDKAKNPVNIFNLGHNDTINLQNSIPIITTMLGIKPEIIWSGNEVGWVGDSKICHLDVTKIKALGWAPKVGIVEAIGKTVNWLYQNEWILAARGDQ
jgi:UDP-glucose 4-epimerase